MLRKNIYTFYQTNSNERFLYHDHISIIVNYDY